MGGGIVIEQCCLNCPPPSQVAASQYPRLAWMCALGYPGGTTPAFYVGTNILIAPLRWHPYFTWWLSTAGGLMTLVHKQWHLATALTIDPRSLSTMYHWLAPIVLPPTHPNHHQTMFSALLYPCLPMPRPYFALGEMDEMSKLLLKCLLASIRQSERLKLALRPFIAGWINCLPITQHHSLLPAKYSICDFLTRELWGSLFIMHNHLCSLFPSRKKSTVHLAHNTSHLHR